MGCKTLPIYNKIGAKKAIYCVKHKLSDMIDIKNKTCIFVGCKSRPIFGKPGIKISHCSKHREIGMIKRSFAKCKNCKNPAIFGINYTNLYCETHKRDIDINLVENECKSCKLISILNKDNLCEYCNPLIFKTARLAKQNALMNYLDCINLKGNSTDKTVNPSCGLERPDRVFETNEFILILECDENQHKNIVCSCEQIRMVNIGQGYGGIPVYFIRWNPDNYNSYKSCDDINKRHKFVGKFIQSILDNRVTLPKHLVSAIYLYYDDWDGLSKEDWKIITEIKKY